MKLSQIYQQTSPVISIELYPPKTEKGWHNLCQRLPQLTSFNLGYVSVTYGAGGSTRDKTLQLSQVVREQTGLTCMPHFTAVGASRQSVRDFVDATVAHGMENLLALRGDPPQDAGALQSLENEFRYANELVDYVASYTDKLELAVAGYPEGHVEADSLAQDIEHLKRKVDAGARLVVTQLFFDNAYFYKFRELAVQAGITVPIVPGLMPITKLSQVDRIVSLCGATIPNTIRDRLAAHEDGSPEQQQVGFEYATHQLCDLLANDVPGVHLYILNNWGTITRLTESLN